MYHNIIRRVPRPRGLGGVARAASGMGAWVVDRPWGLSPSIIPGQPQPYQGMVRTQLPRSQHPRMLNVDYRVVAGGSWPRLLPANSPVFRTPVMAPGAQAVNETLPGDPVPSGTAGYGWVPLGVAHPPYFLAERHDMSGYGGSGDALRLVEDEHAWLEQNPAKVKKAISDTAIAYAALLAQQNVFHTMYNALSVSDAALENTVTSGRAASTAYVKATLAAYGKPGDSYEQATARKHDAAKQMQRLAAAAVEIDLVLKKEGISATGPISILASQPSEDISKLLRSPKALSFDNGVGAGFTLGVMITVAVLAAVAASAVTVSVMAAFNEADKIREQNRAAWLASTSASREEASETLKALYVKLKGAKSAEEQQRIQNAITTVTNSMATLEGANRALGTTSGAITDWGTWAMIGGAALGVWWLLGKPFWAGARTRAKEFAARRSAPRNWLGTGA
jgi:hypothetical protein